MSTADITVKAVLRRGICATRDFVLPPGSVVETLQEALADARWMWQRKDLPVPASYLVFLPTDEDLGLPLQTPLVDGERYLVKIAKKGARPPAEDPRAPEVRGNAPWYIAAVVSEIVCGRVFAFRLKF